MDATSDGYVHNKSHLYSGTETSDELFTRRGISGKGEETCVVYVESPARWGYAICMESEKVTNKCIEMKAKCKDMKVKCIQMKVKCEEVKYKGLLWDLKSPKDALNRLGQKMPKKTQEDRLPHFNILKTNMN